MMRYDDRAQVDVWLRHGLEDCPDPSWGNCFPHFSGHAAISMTREQMPFHVFYARLCRLPRCFKLDGVLVSQIVSRLVL
jgi:hypothetical protein